VIDFLVIMILCLLSKDLFEVLTVN